MSAQIPTPAPLQVSESAYADTWGIFYPNAVMLGIYGLWDFMLPVFNVDSCVHLNFKGGAKTSKFPVEQGSFVDYNKVQEPYDIKLQLAVGGSSARMEKFISTLKDKTVSTELFTVITPEAIYKNATITSYSFKRATNSGRNMLLADVELVEVREVPRLYGTSAIEAPKTGKLGKPGKDAKEEEKTGKQAPKEIKPIHRLTSEEADATVVSQKKGSV